MLIVCGSGAEVPLWKKNDSCWGLTFTAAGAATVTVTGTASPVVPGGEIATIALYTPGLVKSAGFTVTLIGVGVVDVIAVVVGLTVSQFPGEPRTGVTETLPRGVV